MPDLPSPQPADGQRIYAVGDIHGCATLLDRVLDLVRQHAERAQPVREQRLVFLGDYIDRGPDSFAVVEHLLTRLPDGFAADFLMGNHERLLIDALDDPRAVPGWLANGAGATLRSYAEALQIEPHRLLSGALPSAHEAFYRSLRLHVTHGDYLFVHAGIVPGRPLEQQQERDLLWVREPFLAHPGPHPKVVVHGHTPSEQPELHRWRIGIDTGAVFTGHLTALVLDGERQEILST